MHRLKGILLLSVFVTVYISSVTGSSCDGNNDQLIALDFPQDLTSPGYPLKYPRNTICTWTVLARDPNKTVVMETAEVMLHVGPECDLAYDALYVYYDKNDVTANWTLCGQDRQRIMSPGRSLDIAFISDNQYEGKGFKVRYYQVDAQSPCNFELTASAFFENSFSSPGYPGGYFNNLECNYTIRPETPGHRIEIEVIDSDIEDSTHCQYDRLTVIDQNNETEQILGTICGSETSKYQSSGNSLRIQFISNSRKVNKGFEIFYKSVDIRTCRVTRQATRMGSYIVSPGYPFQYYSNLTCGWFIKSGDNRTVDVSVIKSNIAGYGPNCTGDKLDILDEQDRETVFCGNKTATFAVKSARVRLLTDGVTEDQGFLIRYRLQEENITLAACGGKLEANRSRQTLQSPLYPDTPLVNQTCVWKVTAADPKEIIMLSLDDLDIEMSNGCVFDRLSIYNGSSMVDGKILETLCGQREGEVIYSTGPQLTIVYKVDDSNNARGFSLMYSTVTGINSTVETLHMIVKDTVSYLSSPGYTYYFPRNRVFSYIFTAAEGYKVYLEVTRSSLPGTTTTNPDGCTSDTNAIAYDGPTNTAPRLPSIYSQYFTWCGQDMPLYVSSDSSMLLEYHTGSKGDKDVGFELRYKQGSYSNWRYHECGGWLTASSTNKNLTSPNYPSNYRNNELCRWVIHASTNGSMIRLTGLDITLQGDFLLGNCSFDSITVYDGSEAPGNRKEVWCGSMSKIFQTTGSVLTIVFRTDSRTTDTGFRFEYFETTDPPPCVKAVSVMNGGYVESPGYDQQTLPPNKTCTWIFSRYTSSIYYIKLEVTSSSSGDIDNQTCSSNSIEVYDGMTDSSPKIGRFCGGGRKTFVGSEATIMVKMITGPYPVSKGFRIAYTAGFEKVCDHTHLIAHLNDSILTSPFYPVQYPNNMECSWDISSNEYNYVVVVEVLVTDVEYTQHCDKDYMVAYDGGAVTSGVIDRWCGAHTQQYQSTGEYLTVEFHTDGAVSKSGFKLKYWKKYHPFVRYHDNTNVAAIVGGSLGGTVAFLAVILVVILVVHRRSKQRLPVQATTGNVQLYSKSVVS